MVKAKAKQTKKSAKPRMGVRKAAPAATSRRVMTSATGPAITRSSAGCRIKHREYVSPVSFPTTGSAPYSDTFDLKSWPVNPGIASLFPWLSPVANQYELYRFHSLRFVYIARTGTSTGGALRMAFDHDAMDEDPSTRDVMMSYAGATSDVVWKDQVLTVPAARLDLGMPNGRYTRMGVHAVADLKSYDCGKFLLAVSGWGTAQEIGEFYVEYDVELMVPQRRSVAATGVERSDGVNTPTGDALDKRIFAILGKAVPDILGSIPAMLEEQTAVDGTVHNVLKFLAPFTGVITSTLRGDVYDVPAASLSLEAAPAPATVTPVQAFRDAGPSSTRSFNQWLVDVPAQAVLKLSNLGAFPGSRILHAALAYSLLSKSAFAKYEL